MTDLKKSLGNLALAATVSFAAMQSNAADVSKLPEAVIAKCRADAMRELAGLKAANIQQTSGPQSVSSGN
jgi:hypothetical protein